MPTTLKIPLTDTFYEEVEDAFIDKPITAQKFIFGLIKGMCKDAKAGKLNRTCSVNLIKKGQVVQEFVKLKDVKLEDYTLKSDPKWLPKDAEIEHTRYWEHMVTDKTMEYIVMYCQYVGLRFERYNESVEKDGEERIAQLEVELKRDLGDVQAPDDIRKNIQEQIDSSKKRIEEDRVKTEESTPKCIEHCIFTQIYPKLHAEVMKNLDTEFDKEYEEMYPPAKVTPPTPPTRLPGTRPQ